MKDINIQDKNIIGEASGFVEIEIDDEFQIEVTEEAKKYIEESLKTINLNEGVNLK